MRCDLGRYQFSVFDVGMFLSGDVLIAEQFSVENSANRSTAIAPRGLGQESACRPSATG